MRRSKLLRNFDFGKKTEISLESVFSHVYIIAPHVNTRKVERIRDVEMSRVCITFDNSLNSPSV